MRLGDGQQQIKDRELRAAETTVSNWALVKEFYISYHSRDL